MAAATRGGDEHERRTDAALDPQSASRTDRQYRRPGPLMKEPIQGRRITPSNRIYRGFTLDSWSLLAE
jgi:hypothetical protein